MEVIGRIFRLCLGSRINDLKKVYYHDYFHHNFHLSQLGDKYTKMTKENKIKFIEALLDKIYNPSELKSGIKTVSDYTYYMQPKENSGSRTWHRNKKVVFQSVGHLKKASRVDWSNLSGYSPAKRIKNLSKDTRRLNLLLRRSTLLPSGNVNKELSYLDKKIKEKGISKSSVYF